MSAWSSPVTLCQNATVCVITWCHLCYYNAFTIVISEPDDITICEGRSTTFTCVWSGSISSDDVQWYRLIMDTSTTVMVDPQDSNIQFTTSTTNNTLTSSLTITNAVKSYTGYYWVRLPSDDVCNVSLTVVTSMWIYSCVVQHRFCFEQILILNDDQKNHFTVQHF